MKKKRENVLVCMSGGVDSSVTAALLVREGYDVTGAYMKQWSDTQDVNGVCTWKTDRRDALRVAAHLDIPLITLDFEKEYREWVTEYMFAEYEAGRTPNPDVLCNKYIKFDAWLKKAKEMGFEKMATGHYANLRKQDSGSPEKLRLGAGRIQYQLTQAKDADKDQTYFLHQLTSEQLSYTLFPLGPYLKSEIREMAEKWQLPTAKRAESMGICFVGEVPMKDFLLQRIEKKTGDILLSSGEKVGEHDGLAFYTVGQRGGLGLQNCLSLRETDKERGNLSHSTQEIASSPSGTSRNDSNNKPLYVLQKNIEKNQLIVGYEDDPLLMSTQAALTDIHFISGEEPSLPLSCKARLRHRQELQDVTLTKEKDTYRLQFVTPQKAITPGQFAVLYSNDLCLGGGVVF